MKKVLGKVKEQIQKTPEAVKAVYGNAVEKLNGGLGKIGNMGVDAKDKVVDFGNEIISILPILEKFGYKTSELRVGVSISPTIEMDVLKVEDIPKELHDVMLQTYKAKSMFSLILKALESAGYIQDRLKIGDDYYHEFSLQISMIPNIGIKYRLKEKLALPE